MKSYSITMNRENPSMSMDVSMFRSIDVTNICNNSYCLVEMVFSGKDCEPFTITVSNNSFCISLHAWTRVSVTCTPNFVANDSFGFDLKGR